MKQLTKREKEIIITSMHVFGNIHINHLVEEHGMERREAISKMSELFKTSACHISNKTFQERYLESADQLFKLADETKKEIEEIAKRNSQE